MSFVEQTYCQIAAPGKGVLNNWFYPYPTKNNERKFYTLHIHSVYVFGVPTHHDLGPIGILSDQIRLESTYHTLSKNPKNQLLFFGILQGGQNHTINTFEQNFIRFQGNPRTIEFKLCKLDDNLNFVTLGHSAVCNITLECTIN